MSHPISGHLHRIEPPHFRPSAPQWAFGLRACITFSNLTKSSVQYRELVCFYFPFFSPSAASENRKIQNSNTQYLDVPTPSAEGGKWRMGNIIQNIGTWLFPKKCNRYLVKRKEKPMCVFYFSLYFIKKKETYGRLARVQIQQDPESYGSSILNNTDPASVLNHADPVSWNVRIT